MRDLNRAFPYTFFLSSRLTYRRLDTLLLYCGIHLFIHFSTKVAILVVYCLIQINRIPYLPSGDHSRPGVPLRRKRRWRTVSSVVGAVRAGDGSNGGFIEGVEDLYRIKKAIM